MLTINHIISILLTLIIANLSLNAADSCKVRMPDGINRFQPIIVPVVSLDGNEIYFDIKNHPYNVGGSDDRDDIWTSERSASGVWSEARPLDNHLNTAGYDVLFSLSPDGATALVYGIYDGKGQKKDGFSVVRRINGEWGKPAALDIEDYYNNTDKFFAHLGYDGKVLLMSLNRNDSHGSLDLYVSIKNENTGRWSRPKNLGAAINTEEIEGAPFLAYDGKTLYFSSNGRDGYGGVDLFISRRLDSTWTNWSLPKNLGPGINTIYEENSIWLSALSDTAYIVSSDSTHNREGIYYACLPEGFRPYPYAIVYGKLWLDSGGTRTPFAGQTEIRVYDDAGNEGLYYSIPGKAEYLVVDNSSGMGKGTTAFNKTYGYGKGYYDFGTKPRQPFWVRYDRTFEKKRPPVRSDTLAIIYFDTGVDTLTEAAKSLIGRLLSKIEGRRLLIVGHCDEQGRNIDNNALSGRRANNTSVLLRSLGILQTRIRVEAKGESQPVSANLAANRRVVIIILAD